MKRSAVHIGACAITFIALSAPIACGDGSPGADADGARAPATTDHATHGSGAKVVMSLIAYEPGELTVARSKTVTWEQRDAGVHTVTSGTVETDASGTASTAADGVFASDELEKGDEFAFTFDRAGTYAYFCRIHPATMRGRITVE